MYWYCLKCIYGWKYNFFGILVFIHKHSNPFKPFIIIIEQLQLHDMFNCHSICIVAFPGFSGTIGKDVPHMQKAGVLWTKQVQHGLNTKTLLITEQVLPSEIQIPVNNTSPNSPLFYLCQHFLPSACGKCLEVVVGALVKRNCQLNVGFPKIVNLSWFRCLRVTILCET
jgi:hypothetical protein